MKPRVPFLCKPDQLLFRCAFWCCKIINLPVIILSLVLECTWPPSLFVCWVLVVNIIIQATWMILLLLFHAGTFQGYTTYMDHSWECSCSSFKTIWYKRANSSSLVGRRIRWLTCILYSIYSRRWSLAFVKLWDFDQMNQFAIVVFGNPAWNLWLLLSANVCAALGTFVNLI